MVRSIGRTLDDMVLLGKGGQLHSLKKNRTLVMVFLGLRTNGTFGLKFQHHCRKDVALEYTVLPQLRALNGGNLDNLYWMQD